MFELHTNDSHRFVRATAKGMKQRLAEYIKDWLEKGRDLSEVRFLYRKVS